MSKMDFDPVLILILIICKQEMYNNIGLKVFILLLVYVRSD